MSVNISYENHAPLGGTAVEWQHIEELELHEQDEKDILVESDEDQDEEEDNQLEQEEEQLQEELLQDDELHEELELDQSQ